MIHMRGRPINVLRRCTVIHVPQGRSPKAHKPDDDDDDDKLVAESLSLCFFATGVCFCSCVAWLSSAVRAYTRTCHPLSATTHTLSLSLSPLPAFYYFLLLLNDIDDSPSSLPGY